MLHNKVKVKFIDNDGVEIDDYDRVRRRILAMDTPVVTNRKYLDLPPPPIPKDTHSLSSGVPLDPELVKLADQNKLTEKVLKDADFTQLLRLGTYQPASKFIMDKFGYRGLPLLAGHGDKLYKIDPHQAKAILWMRDRERKPIGETHGVKGGILCLEKGLGKTLTALTHILVSPKGEFPSLVIASKSVMNMWKRDGVEQFFGSNIKVLYFHDEFIGKKGVEGMTSEQIRKYDLVVTTYDLCLTTCRKYSFHQEILEIGEANTLMKDKIVAIHCRTKTQANKPHLTGARVLYGTPWHRVVCDESQRFCNPKTATYQY